MKTQVDFYTSILDTLDHQIAVISQSGQILYVNRAWVNFGVCNGMPLSFDWLGQNYLHVCNADEADLRVAAYNTHEGILAVINRKLSSFEAEYPCHSPTERRWFMMRISAMQVKGQPLFLVSHTNITARKLAEEELAALSMTDPLTNLANRRKLSLFLQDEWARAARQKTCFSVLVIDIDHFKQLNDSLGHSAGDECLIELSKVLLNYTNRPSDLAARLGGEEFVLVLGDTTLAEAVAIAELVRSAVMGLNIRFGDKQLLTVSIGVSEVEPVKHKKISAIDEINLLDEADQALYAAKANGRNRVEQFNKASILTKEC